MLPRAPLLVEFCIQKLLILYPALLAGFCVSFGSQFLNSKRFSCAKAELRTKKKSMRE